MSDSQRIYRVRREDGEWTETASERLARLHLKWGWEVQYADVPRPVDVEWKPMPLQERRVNDELAEDVAGDPARRSP